MKNLIRLSMLLVLSLFSSTLFAQSLLSPEQMEAKLTDNGKIFVWYKDVPAPASKGDQTKSLSYAFTKDHKVVITTGDKKTNSTWKLEQVPTSETARSMTTKLTIGGIAYILAFGSEKDHLDFISLKLKNTTSYFNALALR